MSKIWMWLLIAIILFIVGYCLLINETTIYTTDCLVLDKKHVENEPKSGGRGDFTVKRYFLMKSGELEEVDLKTYMKFEPGQTVCFKRLDHVIRTWVWEEEPVKF